MISSNLPAHLANLVAPYSPVGNQPVGQEGASVRNITNSNTTIPVEQLASSGRQQLTTRSHEPAPPPVTTPSEDSLATTDAQNTPEGSSDQQTQQAQPQDQAQEQHNLKQEQQQIEQLSSRDREVRAHERAHAAVGGQYAGAAEYKYERGPDGVLYAVSGEVPINIGKEPTHQATIDKAQVVKRAALAPADPSPQDRRVAAQAARLETEARRELAVERSQESAAKDEATSTENTDIVSSPLATTELAASDSEDDNSAHEAAIDFIRSSDTLLSSRLNQGIANASLSSREPGDILDQIV